MNWRAISGWIFVVGGLTALVGGDVTETASVLMIGIGVYLIVNSNKKEIKKK